VTSLLRCCLICVLVASAQIENACAETILSESFENGVLDSRISVQTVGTFRNAPGIEPVTQLGSAHAFGFGRSNCGASCFQFHSTALHIVFPEPVYVSSISFKEMELYENWGSGGNVAVDGVALENSYLGRQPYNDRQPDSAPRQHDLPVGKPVKEIVIYVGDITNLSEVFLDDLRINSEAETVFDADFTTNAISVIGGTASVVGNFVFDFRPERTDDHWAFKSHGASFTITFPLQAPGNLLLQFEHLTSLLAGATNDGFSPIDVLVNNQPFLDDYDPGVAHGGNKGFVSDQFLVPAGLLASGTNQITVAIQDAAESQYWIRHMRAESGIGVVTPAPLVPDDQLEGEGLGGSIALSDDYLVIGAPATNGNKAGRVRLFARSGDGYVEQSQTGPVPIPFQDPDDPAAELNFGESVAVSGRTIIVGAPADVAVNGSKKAFGSASVFFFDGTSWVHQGKFLDFDNDCKSFGTSVAINGDDVVVGAPGGACARVFERTGTTWAPKALLRAGSPSGRFGQSVGISEGSILIGAPGAAGSGHHCMTQGSVYAYRKSGSDWILDTTIVEPSDTGGGACFGTAVAIDGATGVVGTPGDDGGAEDAGAAYVIQHQAGHWFAQTKLLAFPTPAAGDGFGGAVDTRLGLVLVGSPGAAAYLFQFQPEAASLSLRSPNKSLWPPRGLYLPPPEFPPSVSKFAFSVAVASGLTAVGAPATRIDELSEAGAAFPDDSAPKPTIVCGDGTVELGEGCDDGDVSWSQGQPCDEQCHALKCGDTNDSGTLTSADAYFALRVASGSSTCARSVCDVTRDLQITSVDALKILRAAVALEGELSCS